MPWTLAKLDVAHVATLDALGELAGNFGKRDDRVAPPLRRHAVDEVDDAILQAADAEAVNHMRDERCGAHSGCSAARAVSTASMEGRMSRTNWRSVSCAASARSA